MNRRQYLQMWQPDKTSATALGALAFGWHASIANTILRLMASNTFDRHPKLKIIIGHSGELIPYMFATRLLFHQV